jgi:hypothetical protein
MREGSNEAIPKARGAAGSREAIVEAAEHLFLERGFGSPAWTSRPGPGRFATMASPSSTFVAPFALTR